MNRFLALAAYSVLAASPTTAAIRTGAITGGSALGAPRPGAFILLNPAAHPFTVGNNNFNTTNLYGFNELQGVTLTSAVAANLGVRNIPIGTRINSHFLFFDPLLNHTLQGGVVFDTPVLSAMTLSPALIASNFLGAPNVTYRTPSSFGLEPGIDLITLSSPNRNSIRINFLTADSPGDHFRVITAAAPLSAVPEAATWLQLALGFGLIGGLIRRRRGRLAIIELRG
jgi:hypothetical protein